MPPPISSSARPGAERRREKRYQVDLAGAAGIDGPLGNVVIPVLVSELSTSGALITAVGADETLAKGASLILQLQEFGNIEARVVHVGNGFYGLSFANPHLHRDRLTAWLREELARS